MEKRSFFEMFGKFCFARLRPPFFYLILALPLTLSLIYMSLKLQEISLLEDRFQAAVKKAKEEANKKEIIQKLEARSIGVGVEFLEKHLETITLLEEESNKVKTALTHPLFKDKQEWLAWMEKLEKNKINFKQTAFHAKGKIKESSHRLKDKIFVDEKDLKKILAILEDQKIDDFLPVEKMPELKVQEILLKKAKSPLGKDYFEMQLDLYLKQTNL